MDSSLAGNSEQAIWISLYLYSVGAVDGESCVNSSVCGWILLCLHFQGSSDMTEMITLGKYPKYAEYMRHVPLYIPGFTGTKTKTS